MGQLCFLCGSEKYRVIHRGVRGTPDIDVLKCDGCGLVRLSEFQTNDKYYQEAAMRRDDTEKNLKEIRTTARMDDKRRFHFCRRMIENKTVLDFGCGAGGGLNYFRQEAKEVYGVELEASMQKVLTAEGITCFPDIEHAVYGLPGKIDAVTLFHVLEHLPEPLDMLEKIKKLLSPEGIIIIEVPNAEDALLSLYQNEKFADFTYWEAHLFLYSNTTFRMLMDRAGLKVKFLGQVQRYPLSNTLHWLAEGKPGGHKTWAMLSNEDLDREYGRQMAQLGMADTIIAVVGKQ